MSDAPDWVTLTPGEEIVWEGHPSIVPYLTTTVGEFVVLVLGVLVWLAGGVLPLVGGVVGSDLAPVWATVASAVAAVLVIAGALGIAGTLLRWWSVRYLITTEELYQKSGLLSRTVRNVRLQEVQNTTMTQSALGRLASYGDVRAATAGTGGTEITFRHVSEPQATLERITRQLDRVAS